MQPETIPEFGEHQQVQVTQPTNTAELGQAVRDAGAQGLAVFPLGGRTMLHLGYPPSKPGIGVDLSRLDQVIDYPARDMTITVQAGITIAKLQDILAKENQQLPVDVPLPDQATLGGAIAVNASGPRRYGYGTLRDYVIGISFLNDEGEEVKAGGRVVKNVAGYDMMKLHIGALGTLGVVTQVTLKVRPLAEARYLEVSACQHEGIESMFDKVHRSRAQPVCLDLVNHSAARWVHDAGWTDLPDAEFVLVAGFEGNGRSVSWEHEQWRTEVRPLARAAGVVGYGPYTTLLLQMLTEFCLLYTAGLTFKANVAPNATAGLVRTATSISEGLLLQAQAGNGIVYGHVDDLTLGQAKTMLTKLQDAVGPDGNVVVVRCPSEWKRDLPIWGKPRGDYALMRRVKQALDPRGIFNPGRFVDGI
jgi:glycolate oxidase FAD binding subunit